MDIATKAVEILEAARSLASRSSTAERSRTLAMIVVNALSFISNLTCDAVLRCRLCTLECIAALTPYLQDVFKDTEPDQIYDYVKSYAASVLANIAIEGKISWSFS